jgi:hypothetical protein
MDKYKPFLFDDPFPWKTTNEDAPLFEIIATNIHQPWHWYKLSRHPGLTWDFLDQHIHHGWDWMYLSLHVPFWIVFKHNDKDWRCSRTVALMRDTTISAIDVILQHPQILDEWEWDKLTLQFDFELVVQHPDLLWRWDILHDHRGFRKDVVTQFPDKRWLWRKIDISMMWDCIQRFKDANWDWEWIFQQGHIDWRVFTEKANGPIVFQHTSSIPLEWLEPNIEANKDLDYTKILPTYELIDKYPYRPWKAYKMIKLNMNWKYVAAYPYLDWGYEDSLSGHVNLPWPIVLACGGMPWNWKCLTKRLMKQEKWHILCCDVIRQKICWDLVKSPPIDIVAKYWKCPWQRQVLK